MYQNLKLEKGLYHLTNKSFVQALEALDPSAQYADTPLAGLDAYERQLKRFDIRISGAQCDRVEPARKVQCCSRNLSAVPYSRALTLPCCLI